ncbi:MAG: DUF2110 family protein [Promethearchaeota archaeon]
MKNLVLYDKIYNISNKSQEKEVYVRYLKYLNEKTKGFSQTSIQIKKLRKFDKRFEILIDGPEEIFVFNLIKKEIGSVNEFNDIEVGKQYKGTLIDVGKFGFGIFVDCAILNPQIDVLLTLNVLRDQLCAGKKKSVREIIKAYDFIDHFPVEVKITEIDAENHQIQGRLSDASVGLYQKIVSENLEGIFVSGATKNQFKKALIKRGHLRDIISVERHGFLENIVILKEGTDAPGIIAHIGKYLKNCKLSAIRHERICKLLE